MSLRGLSILGVVLLMGSLLAGCLADDPVEVGTNDPSQTSRVTGDCEGEPRTSDSTGAVAGAVSTELFEPLVGAKSILLDEDREPLQETETENGGEFVFCDLEPGSYVVQVLRDGYETTLRGANVQPAEVTRVSIQMLLLPSSDPYLVEEDVRGAINWAYWHQVEVPGEGCMDNPLPSLPYVPGNTCSGGRSAYSTNFRGWFESVDNETKTVHVEMAWNPAAVVGENLQLHLFCPEAETSPGSGDREHPCYYIGPQMTSPILIRVDEVDWLEHELDPAGDWWWHVYAGYGLLGTYPTLGADIGVAYEQEYTIYITVFQREAAPEGYSRVPEE